MMMRLPALIVGHDHVVPVRQKARDCVLQAFRQRQFVRRYVVVPGVVCREARVVRRECGRWHVVAASPDLHLLLAELRCCLGLVQSLQRPVVALIETPAVVHGDPHQVESVEHGPQRSDGALQDGSVGDVEGVAVLL